MQTTSTHQFSNTPCNNKGYQKAKKFWKDKNENNLLKPKRAKMELMHQLFAQDRCKEATQRLNEYLMGKDHLNTRDFLAAVKRVFHDGNTNQRKKIVGKIEISEIKPTVRLIRALADMVSGPDCDDILKLILKLKERLNESPIFTTGNYKNIFTLNHVVFKAAIATKDTDQCLITLAEMKKNGEYRDARTFVDFLALCLAKEGGGPKFAIEAYIKFWPKRAFLDEEICLQMLREGIESKQVASVVRLIVEQKSRRAFIPYSLLFNALKLLEDSDLKNTEKILGCLGAKAGFEKWLHVVRTYAHLGKAAAAINTAASIWMLRRSFVYFDKGKLMKPLIDVCVKEEVFGSFFCFISQFNIGQDAIIYSDLQKILGATIASNRGHLLGKTGWPLNRESGIAVVDKFIKNKDLMNMIKALQFLDQKKDTLKGTFDYILENYQGFFQAHDFIDKFLLFIKDHAMCEFSKGKLRIEKMTC